MRIYVSNVRNTMFESSLEPNFIDLISNYEMLTKHNMVFLIFVPFRNRYISYIIYIFEVRNVFQLYVHVIYSIDPLTLDVGYL